MSMMPRLEKQQAHNGAGLWTWQGVQSWVPTSHQPGSLPPTTHRRRTHGLELPADPDAWNKKSTREKRMFIGNRLRRMKWYEKFQASFNKKLKKL